jgi:serine/threonine protein kinase
MYVCMYVCMTKRNINWSSPEILSFSLDNGTTSKVDQSADIWSLAMVLSEIFTGEIPYDSQYYRQMDIHAFNAAIKEGHRPKVPPRMMNITWLSKLVSTFFSSSSSSFPYCNICLECVYICMCMLL